MARHLEVWLLGAHTGTLSQIDGRLSFAYAPGVTQPLSPHGAPSTHILKPPIAADEAPQKAA